MNAGRWVDGSVLPMTGHQRAPMMMGKGLR